MKIKKRWILLAVVLVAILSWTIVSKIFLEATTRYRMTVYVNHEGQEYVGTNVQEMTYAINLTPAGLRMSNDFKVKSVHREPVRVDIDERTSLLFPADRGSSKPCGFEVSPDGMFPRVRSILASKFGDWDCENVIYPRDVFELISTEDGFETRRVSKGELDFRVAVERTSDDFDYGNWTWEEVAA